MNTDKEILKKVYTAKTKSELMSAYDEWAGDYEKDLDDFGYRAPLESVGRFLKYVPASAEIMDAGCGTGLVGYLLSENGCENISGLDYSEKMLTEAHKKNIYKELFHADLTRDIDIQPDSYDALICVGTFTYGHVHSDAFDRIADIVKPGGYIVFTVREGAYEELEYRKKMVQMEYDGVWELQELTDAVYFSDDQIHCKLAVYKVL